MALSSCICCDVPGQYASEARFSKAVPCNFRAHREMRYGDGFASDCPHHHLFSTMGKRVVAIGYEIAPQLFSPGLPMLRVDFSPDRSTQRGSIPSFGSFDVVQSRCAPQQPDRTPDHAYFIARRRSRKGMKLATLGFEVHAILACSEGTRSMRRCGRCRVDNAVRSPLVARESDSLFG